MARITIDGDREKLADAMARVTEGQAMSLEPGCTSLAQTTDAHSGDSTMSFVRWTNDVARRMGNAVRCDRIGQVMFNAGFVAAMPFSSDTDILIPRIPVNHWKLARDTMPAWVLLYRRLVRSRDYVGAAEPAHHEAPCPLCTVLGTSGSYNVGCPLTADSYACSQRTTLRHLRCSHWVARCVGDDAALADACICGVCVDRVP